jgi:ABC-type amino acid transport substrate-binding protein
MTAIPPRHFRRVHARLLPLALVLASGACDPRPGQELPPDTGVVAEVIAYDPPGPVTRTSFEDARAAGEAQIAFFYVPSSGFAYLDAEGHLTGVTVELLRDFAGFVAGTHGIDLEVEWIEEERWADFYQHVLRSRGGVFGIGNVTITEARRDELDFSPPYMNNVAVLATHTDVPELESLEEIGEAFRGMTALPYPGTLHEARLEAIRDRYFPDMALRPVASNDELVSHLGSGEDYFGYIDIYNYWRAREAGRPLRRHPVGDDASETFGVILPQGSDWTAVIEAFFGSRGGYVESPRFQGLLLEHLGEELASLLVEG